MIPALFVSPSHRSEATPPSFPTATTREARSSSALTSVPLAPNKRLLRQTAVISRLALMSLASAGSPFDACCPRNKPCPGPLVSRERWENFIDKHARLFQELERGTKRGKGSIGCARLRADDHKQY